MCYVILNLDTENIFRSCYLREQEGIYSNSWNLWEWILYILNWSRENWYLSPSLWDESRSDFDRDTNSSEIYRQRRSLSRTANTLCITSGLYGDSAVRYTSVLCRGILGCDPIGNCSRPSRELKQSSWLTHNVISRNFYYYPTYFTTPSVCVSMPKNGVIICNTSRERCTDCELGSRYMSDTSRRTLAFYRYSAPQQTWNICEIDADRCCFQHSSRIIYFSLCLV